MAQITKAKTGFGMRLQCRPFAHGKFSTMAITADVGSPAKRTNRCEIEIVFPGTGVNSMRPGEAVVFIEAVKAVGKEARALADKMTGKKSEKPSKKAKT